MDTVRAFIENIIYHNEDNHYSVLEASQGGEPITLVGTFPYVSAGETVEAEGSYTSHPTYGEQFSVTSFKIIPPEGAAAVEAYLAGGAVKGIGPALAKRIVKRFKADTFRIIEEEPERLAEVKGISEAMAMQIAEQAEKKKDMREACLFMQQYGIGPALANRIYERYGAMLYVILKSNPYRLAEEIEGVGFTTADGIAVRMGLAQDSEYRIRCGITHVLARAAADGNTYLPGDRLLAQSSELLGLRIDDLESHLMRLQMDGYIVIADNRSGDQTADGLQVFLSGYYHTEADIAGRLSAMAVSAKTEDRDAESRIAAAEEETGIILDEKQREAVRSSLNNGLLIITGGPGTGKTTVINTLIRLYTGMNLSVVLAAPTGRAAKRMTEATGCEAKTIHRLLEYTGVPEQGNAPGNVGEYEGTYGGPGAVPYGGSGNAKGAGSTSGKGRFMRDEKDPLEADVVIIDEMSMVDIFLMDALLKAVVPGTRLILVGDYDQLPSVGPGKVLRDLIDSEAFGTVRLEHVFRQAARSDIVLNAHRINRGEAVDLAKKSRDFLFIRSSSPENIIEATVKLITEKLPGYIGCGAFDIQVLTATRKGALGVENLNRILQSCLNPARQGVIEQKHGDGVLREGDKVMQMKNDYELEWTRYDNGGRAAEHGSGVFNGDTGRILKIDRPAETVTVIFDEARQVIYDRKQLMNIELAYAVTVHKSQGSEYPAVVMPMFRGPHLLMNRNLLYTAVTRAKKCVCLVGHPQVFEEMKRNEDETKRLSGLRERIAEGRSVSSEVSGLR
ncbi:MAG: AAA family ATPase [Eubacteriales bacterium]|nr:AAA family ATPase [Eubacteriales bacterium]